MPRTLATRNKRIALSLEIGREETSAGRSTGIQRILYSQDAAGRVRQKTAVIGVPVGGRFSADPAVNLAYRIRASLRAPDRMPELRRRLRELRGER